MAKAKAGAKKAKAATKKSSSNRLGLLKSASKKMAKAAAQVVKVASKLAKGAKGKPAQAVKAVKETAKDKAVKAPAAPSADLRVRQKDPAFQGPSPDKLLPRAGKLPSLGQPLTKREMEQLLTAGQGRGVEGEGSLKGRLIVREEFPYLNVVARDKRELVFLLQGPDQEVLPAYLDHKVSVSGLIRKTTNYGGTVDVRKYSAKKPDAEVLVEAPIEAKLKYLSPGDIEQLCSPGMGAGMRGFASFRGNLEMTGDDFFMVVSNGGTRQQVSFALDGKGAKGLRKHVGQMLQVNGVVEKTSGWGGRVVVEHFELRISEHKAVSRDAMELRHVEGSGQGDSIEVKVNQGLTVRLAERAGYTWAIEPTVAKRISLREANFEPPRTGSAATREFFFTPRNPGMYEVEFFLAKAFAPAQVTKTFKLSISVKP